MAVHKEIEHAPLDSLQLDQENPRLGRHNIEAKLPPDKILELMEDWSLEELAISFAESGYWPQEALLVVEEKVGGKPALVVVEGNRRLATMKLLVLARNGKPHSKKWEEYAANIPEETWVQFENIPFIRADSREDVQAYIGFRHVSGIKQWNPAEKAEYIAKLIDDQKMSYREVTRKIGSRLSSVKQHYISYRILLQMDKIDDPRLSVEKVEEKFSVLHLSLRTNGVQEYLQVDLASDDPKVLQKPVPQDKLEHLVKFAMWLFGNDDKEPIISDSRQVEKFAKVLEDEKAVAYLERTENPKFEVAYRVAAGEEAEVIELIESAADSISQALSIVHHYADSKNVQNSVRRLGKDVYALFKTFPAIKKDLDA